MFEKEDRLYELGFDAADASLPTEFSAEEIAEIQQLRNLSADLKSLRNDVPEMQFSVERLRSAIEQSKQVAPARRKLSLLWWIAPATVAASALLIVANMPKSPAEIQPKAGITVAKNDVPKPTTDIQNPVTPEVTPPVSVPEGEVNASKIEPAPTTVRTTVQKPQGKSSNRRRHPKSHDTMTVAKLETNNSASAPSMMTPESLSDAALVEAMSIVSRAGSPATAVGDYSTPEMAPVQGDDIVVVKTSEEVRQGAVMKAVEVQRVPDVVVGS